MCFYTLSSRLKVLKQKVKFSRKRHMLQYITHVKDAQQRCSVNSSEVTVIANGSIIQQSNLTVIQSGVVVTILTRVGSLVGG